MNPTLGEIARRARAAHAEAPKAQMVVADDALPRRQGHRVWLAHNPWSIPTLPHNRHPQTETTWQEGNDHRCAAVEGPKLRTEN